MSAGAPALRRTLRFRDLVLYGLAYIAPYGLLGTLGFVWQSAHGLILLAYLLGAGCMYFTARSYAVMCERAPQAGSVYGFARIALGPMAGFVAGWMILLDYLLVPAYLYLVVAVAVTELAPTLGRGPSAVLVAATTLAINWFGIRVSARVNALSVIVQAVVLGGLVVFGIKALSSGFGTGSITLAPLWDGARFSASGVADATALCIMSYLGFDAISTLSEEVVGSDPRIVGRAIVSTLGIAALGFAVVALVLGNLLPGIAIRDPAAAGYEVATAAIGGWAAQAIAWTNVGFVGLATSVPMQVGVARVLYAMGRDRQLPRVLARIHPRHGTPWVSMIVASVLSTGVALAMRNRLDDLANLVNFGALSAFLMLHACVLVEFGLRRRSRRWLVHWALPLVGIVVVLGVLSGMSRTATVAGLAWLGIGLVFGMLLARRRALEIPLDPSVAHEHPEHAE